MSPVPVEKTVKARAHAGAASLDLTIPAGVCKAQKLAAGDVWSVHVTREGGKLVLRYVLLHSTNGA